MIVSHDHREDNQSSGQHESRDSLKSRLRLRQPSKSPAKSNDDEYQQNGQKFHAYWRKHRIQNPGKIPLHMIEVQSGSYLGEDDIVRFEDRYGRG